MILLIGASYIYMGIVVPVSIIIPICFAIAKYRTFPAELKIVTWYLYFNGITNIITGILASNNINNMPALHIYTALEFIIISIFYKKILEGTIIGKYIHVIILSFLILCVINVVFFQNLNTYNSYTKSLEAIIVISLTIAYFKKTLDKIDILRTIKNINVYINSGILIYFSGSFTLFIISNTISANSSLSNLTWNIHATFLLVMYVLFSFALWQYKK